MAEGRGRERDLLLSPNEFAFIKDGNSGTVAVHVGFRKHTFEEVDVPVVMGEDGRFVPARSLEDAKQLFVTADENSYVRLTNPTGGEHGNRPPKRGTEATPDLKEGVTINIKGPVSFPLWPGQKAEVVKGHTLRTNEYLVVEVKNAEVAQESMQEAVVQLRQEEEEQKLDAPGEGKPGESQGGHGSGKGGSKAQGGKGREAKSEESHKSDVLPDSTELVTGQLMIIKGTEVSFYIPGTGLEVVRGSDGNYVQKAVTLEVMEYCITLDENGSKRYVKGPMVVFPKPTEQFVEKVGDDGKKTRKFRALELNKDMGIPIKVTQDYTDENGTRHKAGEEMFITGEEVRIYFPQEEHAIIKYGSEDEGISYAIAIPAGEARYVLDKDTGNPVLVRGPCMLLPDPSKQVIVDRILEDWVTRLLYPGNEEALAYNQSLRRLRGESTEPLVSAAMAKSRRGLSPRELLDDDDDEVEGLEGVRYGSAGAGLRDMMMSRTVERAAEGFAGDAIQRKKKFTPPRSITLGDKFSGAVSCNVWTNYALLLVSKTGKRRVVVGPQAVILEYDEVPEVLQLSTETPKNHDKVIQTAFLRVKNNQVSDEIIAETSDMVKVRVKVSYRVHFEGEDQEKWFAVENYVKILTDHTRSMVRNGVNKVGITEFQARAIDFIRDTILGESAEGKPRPGRAFDENNMRIYDVEVLDIKIGDADIAALLSRAQKSSVEDSISIAQAESSLQTTRQLERIEQEKADAKDKTAQKKAELTLVDLRRRTAQGLAQTESDQQISTSHVKANAVVDALRHEGELAAQEAVAVIAQKQREVVKADADQQQAIAKANQELEIRGLEAEVKAVVEQANAISPQLVAALENLGQRDLAETIFSKLSSEALSSGQSVASVFRQLVRGSNLEVVLKTLLPHFGDPQSPATGKHDGPKAAAEGDD